MINEITVFTDIIDLKINPKFILVKKVFFVLIYFLLL